MDLGRALASLVLTLALTGGTPPRAIAGVAHEATPPRSGATIVAVATIEAAEGTEPTVHDEEPSFAIDPAAALGEPPRITRRRDAWGPFLKIAGLPALRADGAAVLTLATSADIGSAQLRVFDVRTGELIDTWPFPARMDEDGPDPVRTIDAALLRETTRRIAEDGYRALARLPVTEKPEPGVETRTTFALGALRVTGRTTWEIPPEPTEWDVPNPLELEVTITSAAGVRVLDESPELVGVSMAPDGSFVVLDEWGCTCMCDAWSRVIVIEGCTGEP